MVEAHQVARSHEPQSKLNQKTKRLQHLEMKPLASNITYFITCLQNVDSPIISLFANDGFIAHYIKCGHAERRFFMVHMQHKTTLVVAVEI